MLTKEQQHTIEHSIWVVNTALQKQGLSSDEDLRQSAILYMCKCIERFDPSRDIKWTTYAYRNIYLYIKKKHIQSIKKAQRECPLDQETLYSPQSQFAFEQQADREEQINIRLEHLKSKCSDKELRYMELRLQGYKRGEIGAIMGVTQGVIRGYHENIIQKAKESIL